MNRDDRSVRFLGTAGQTKIAAARVALVGCGGLGTHVAQQLAFLGVSALQPVDHEDLDETNLNRYVSARATDPIPGTPKVDLIERMVHDINPAIDVYKVHDVLCSEQAFEAVKAADYVFGCLDNEGSRLTLTELCAAYARPYFDLATDIVPGDRVQYGGRVCMAWDGKGCPVCLDVIDMKEAQRDLAHAAVRRDAHAIYGVDQKLLGEKGPSVVSVNGVVASLAVTEFMVAVTGVRPPHRLVSYYGHRGIVTVCTDSTPEDCYYCATIRGTGDRAGIARYLRQ